MNNTVVVTVNKNRMCNIVVVVEKSKFEPFICEARSQHDNDRQTWAGKKKGRKTERKKKRKKNEKMKEGTK